MRLERCEDLWREGIGGINSKFRLEENTFKSEEASEVLFKKEC